VVTIDMRENVFSVSYELRLLKLFLRSGLCVVFVRCELRLEKLLRIALFSVAMQHAVVLSYQRFSTTNWPHLDFWIHDSIKCDR
jgi:hypothetical protein